MVKKGTRTLLPQSIWDEEAVLDAFEKYGINKAHHDRFMRAVYEQFTNGQISSLDQFTVPDLNMSPKVLKITQDPDWALMTTKVIRREDSRDKSTTKLLIELQDGEHVESVLMRYSNTQTLEHTRTTLCLSSQIGCAQACSFCATGMLGLSGSLTQGEIVEQFVWCDSQVEAVRNIVFMGQGEPLSNDVYKNVVQAVKILTSSTRFSLRQNRVTVSTVGVVDNMYRTIDELPGVTIALSLHAPTQTMRQKIVPSARKYSLKELVEVIDYYFDKTKKKMLIEYVMLDDVNASEETAHLLGQLLQNRGVLINLIPFNPVLTKAKHVAPSHETVGKFAEIVASYGLMATTRKEFGQDISGACGQLSSGVKKTVKTTTEATEATEETIGYMITDDFTQEEQADTVGHARFKPTGGAGSDEEDDVVDNGLEGLVSAFGWMGPDGNNTAGQGDKYIDNAEIGVTNESILDNTAAGCGDSKGASDDIEDLLVAKAKTTATKNESSEVKPSPTSERELKHQQVTEGIDPNDVMLWSLAVLSLGPILKAEQNLNLRKKGETERARIKRLYAQQTFSDSTEQTNDESNMDQCVAGDDDEERDQFDENTPLSGAGPRRNHLAGSDNLSQNSNMTNFSMTSSQLRAKGPVSSLKIQPREKDLLHRIVIPKKGDVENAKLKTQMDLEKAGWDSIPETYRHNDTSLSTPTTTQTVTTPKKVEQPNPVVVNKTDADGSQKMMVMAVISILIAILAARRIM